MGFTEVVEKSRPDHTFIELETSETNLEDSENVSDNNFHDVQEEPVVQRPQRE